MSGSGEWERTPVGDWQLDRTYHSSSGEVCWQELGTGNACEPVVLLHGTPFSSYVWRGIARALAHEHPVFAWDMPGYGTSEKYEGHNVSLAAQGRVFTELLHHWGLREPWSPHTTSAEPSRCARTCSTVPATAGSPLSTR